MKTMIRGCALWLLSGFLAVASSTSRTSPTSDMADDVTVQLCWTAGRFDQTIYFAEVNDRGDRRDSFEQLLDISGIDHQAIQCQIADALSHQKARLRLMKEWRDSGLEIANTTFLSDLDY